jgi:hypothetical protein
MLLLPGQIYSPRSSTRASPTRRLRAGRAEMPHIVIENYEPPDSGWTISLGPLVPRPQRAREDDDDDVHDHDGEAAT